MVKSLDKHFLAIMSKMEGCLRTYIYLLGDIEEAKNYSVTISMGNGGHRKSSKVFSIDEKVEEIFKEDIFAMNLVELGKEGQGKIKILYHIYYNNRLQ